jgi:hypothetical protein
MTGLRHRLHVNEGGSRKRLLEHILFRIQPRSSPQPFMIREGLRDCVLSVWAQISSQDTRAHTAQLRADLSSMPVEFPW